MRKALMETRASELPDDIVRRIISNHLLCDPTLTNTEAIRLSLLSKELLTAVRRRPVLVFEWNCEISEHVCLQEVEYMISTLTRYVNENIHLDTFRFSCPSSSLRPSRCIHLAADKNLGLKNLSIDMIPYALPEPVFEAESLVQLELGGCSLEPGESIITWPNLRRLSLCSVGMEEGVFENIIRGCPLIEFLEIAYCRCRVKVISNLRYLKKLVLRLRLCEYQFFTLGASPNLDCLDCSGGFLRLLDKYDEYRKLKSIKLSSLGLNGDFLINLAHHFPVLEELTLRYMDLEKINISSPSLKTIQIAFIGGLQEASFDVPNVVLFTFNNGIVPKLSFAGNSGGWTFCISFKFWIHTDSKEFPMKLKEFLAAINMAEASIRVSFKDFDPNISFEARAQKSSASFPGTGIIRDLTVQDVGGFSLPFAREFVDGILLIFRPQRITMILNWQDCEFPKLLYDHLMKPRLNNRNALMRKVTRVELLADESRMNGSWHRVLEQPQVSDRDKFMELFKVNDDHHRNDEFIISFNMDYYCSGNLS